MSGFIARCITEVRMGDVICVNIDDDGILVISPMSQESEYIFRAMAARDFVKDEELEYNPEDNTFVKVDL